MLWGSEPTQRVENDMATVQPFRIAAPDATLERIRAKVTGYTWHEMPDDGGWAYGTNLDYMRELCAYWLEEFDWRAQEAALNRFSQFTAPVADIDIHFIHEKGSGPTPLPLLISHGWPGSVVEFLEIIEPLAHPERFGGSEADAFDVVAPSLPGYGFSGKPKRPIGPRKMAGLFAELMTGVLGYDGYVAQGGDWGGAISSWLGYEHAPACRGIHINIMTMRHVDGPQGAEEEAWAARFEKEQEPEMGYRTQQATKPQTLSYAMMDSPVGVAAWIIEKLNSWSDTEGDESAADQHHGLSGHRHVQHRQLDLLRPPRGRWPPVVAGGQARRGADCLRPVSGRVSVMAAAQLCGAGLQRGALDRDAPRRPLRRHGTAGLADRGHPRLRPRPTVGRRSRVEDNPEGTRSKLVIGHEGPAFRGKLPVAWTWP
jgi:microsomal epoxide hydrolase